MNRHIEEDKNFTTKSQLFEATFLQSSSVAEAEPIHLSSAPGFWNHGVDLALDSCRWQYKIDLFYSLP